MMVSAWRLVYYAMDFSPEQYQKDLRKGFSFYLSVGNKETRKKALAVFGDQLFWNSLRSGLDSLKRGRNRKDHEEWKKFKSFYNYCAQNSYDPKVYSFLAWHFYTGEDFSTFGNKLRFVCTNKIKGEFSFVQRARKTAQKCLLDQNFWKAINTN